MSVARINLDEDEAERLLDSLCERTGTDRAFWDALAGEFVDADRQLREGAPMAQSAVEPSA